MFTKKYLFILLTFLTFLTSFKVNNSENQYNKNTSIEELTSEKVVIQYLKKYKKLPNYYITKTQARQNGWIAKQGNLCETSPNHAIGGDFFTNREQTLPTKKNRKYYEADLNYNCGRRGKDRVVFSNDGLIFVTYNHYKTFQKR